MARGVASAELRVWAPQGAQVLFVRQVAPTVEDLTTRRTTSSSEIGRFLASCPSSARLVELISD